MTKLTLRMLTEQEMADEDAYWARQTVTEAWHQWVLASCEERGGHWWYLDMQPVGRHRAELHRLRGRCQRPDS